MHKKTYLIFALFIIFGLQINAQNNSIIKRKLNIEFSLYVFGSRNIVNNKQGNQITQDNIVFNTGNTIRLSYNLSKNNAFGVGISYYRKNISIDYSLDKDKYNFPFSMYGPSQYTAHIVGFPFSYIFSVPISQKLKFSPQFGYIINFPIIHNSYSLVSYMGDNINNTFLKVNYRNPSLVHNLFFDIGVHRVFRKSEVKLSIIGQIALQNNIFANYTFFEEDPKNFSTGEILSGLGYLGLNISYILTYKNKK